MNRVDPRVVEIPSKEFWAWYEHVQPIARWLSPPGWQNHKPILWDADGKRYLTVMTEDANDDLTS